MKKALTLLVIIWLGATVYGQGGSQVVRGTILDLDSRQPLVGAVVVMLESDPLVGTTTLGDGSFRLDNIPLGRVSLRVQYVGYDSKTLADLVVSAGKELVLDLLMEEAVVRTEPVTITAGRNKDKGAPLNEMAIASSQSISPEQSKRYAGGFNDPSRILSNLAGVTNSQNAENDIIVRGNSPKYIQWRLEGVEIANPTHFADQNGAKGGISALNNDLLSTSDFHTGAFAPEFGNVLSGVYDVKLRSGNNEKFEGAFGFGLLGTDLTLEGPFKKEYGGSYLINYRYSAIGLVNDLGLADINGVLDYQDLALKVVLPSKQFGVFSAFALGGKSGFAFEDVKPDLQSAPGQNDGSESLKEDYDKDNFLLNAGINHVLSLSDRSFLRTTLSYSNTGIDEDVYQSRGENSERKETFNGRLRKGNLGAAIKYSHKFDSRNRIQVGARYTRFNYVYEQQATLDSTNIIPLIDFDEGIATLNNYASWRFKVNEKMSLVAGLHNMNVLFNQKSTLESRLAWQWKFKPSHTLSIGLGEHSSMESIHNYFAQSTDGQGQTIEPNRDLDLLKARHFVLGYEKRFGAQLRAKVEFYYQELYDLPVENLDTSYYATINEGSDFRYTELVNKGAGENYGIELTLERFYDHDFYFLLNGSVYESVYTPLDGKRRNTLYNGNYLVNLLVGRERTGLGKKKNKTLALNAKVFFGGGQKYIPLLRNGQGGLAVDPSNGRFYDYDKAYENSLEEVFQLDFTASYRVDRQQTTHEIFLSIVNVTNNIANLTEYYDESEEGNIGYVSQFGTFPNLLYRVYF